MSSVSVIGRGRINEVTHDGEMSGPSLNTAMENARLRYIQQYEERRGGGGRGESIVPFF